MQNEKKAEIKKNLEHFQQRLSDLKKNNPEGDFGEIEKLIRTLSTMLEEVDNQNYVWISFLKRCTFIVLQYFIYIISFCVVLGFTFNFLSPTDYSVLFYLVPISAAVLLLFRKIVGAVLNSVNSKRTLYHQMFLDLLMISILSIFDYFVFHIFKGFGEVFLFLFLITVFTSIGEYCLSRKWLLF